MSAPKNERSNCRFPITPKGGLVREEGMKRISFKPQRSIESSLARDGGYLREPARDGGLGAEMSDRAIGVFDRRRLPRHNRYLHVEFMCIFAASVLFSRCVACSPKLHGRTEMQGALKVAEMAAGFMAAGAAQAQLKTLGYDLKLEQVSGNTHRPAPDGIKKAEDFVVAQLGGH
jgi:hypothetical protein